MLIRPFTYDDHNPQEHRAQVAEWKTRH